MTHQTRTSQADYNTDAEPLEIIEPGEWVPDWQAALAEDCRAIMTEHVFTSRWALLEGYWLVGQRIITDADYQKFAKGNGASLSVLSRNCGIGERDLYRAMQFYDKYPRLDLLPEGKNISWNKIVTKYLPSPDGSDPDPDPMQPRIAWLKRLFAECWPEGARDRDRARELIMELSGLLMRTR